MPAMRHTYPESPLMQRIHPLGRLIEAERRNQHLTYQDIADRSEQAGYSLSRSTVHRLASEPMLPTISRSNMYGLAAALNVDVVTVSRAVLASWGIDTP